jgi:hypothetical protein
MKYLVDYAFEIKSQKSNDLKNKENIIEIYSHGLFEEIKYILENL